MGQGGMISDSELFEKAVDKFATQCLSEHDKREANEATYQIWLAMQLAQSFNDMWRIHREVHLGVGGDKGLWSLTHNRENTDFYRWILLKKSIRNQEKYQELRNEYAPKRLKSKSGRKKYFLRNELKPDFVIAGVIAGQSYILDSRSSNSRDGEDRYAKHFLEKVSIVAELKIMGRVHDPLDVKEPDPAKPTTKHDITDDIAKLKTIVSASKDAINAYMIIIDDHKGTFSKNNAYYNHLKKVFGDSKTPEVKILLYPAKKGISNPIVI